MRAFIALPLPDTLRARAAAAAQELLDRLGRQRSAQPLRAVPPENMHITLRFLGDVEPGQLDGLSERLAAIAAATAPFDYRLGGMIALPGPASPRVLAAAVTPCPPLHDLAHVVEAAVVAEGFGAERQPFRPHVTLARVRARRPPRLPAGLPAIEAEGRAREVVLYRSDPGHAGQVYTGVRRMELGKR